MPRYDGTGPEGRGSFGRGLGPCSGGDIPTNHGGLFFRWGRRGGGRRFWRFSAPDHDEKNQLETEKNWLEKQLAAVEKRIETIKDD